MINKQNLAFRCFFSRLPGKTFQIVFDKYPESLVRLVQVSQSILLKCPSGVWGFYIFEIFGYSWEKLQHILSAEKFIFIDFLAVKVDGYDVKPGICLYESLCTDSWVDVLEDKIFGW